MKKVIYVQAGTLMFISNDLILRKCPADDGPEVDLIRFFRWFPEGRAKGKKS